MVWGVSAVLLFVSVATAAVRTVALTGDPAVGTSYGFLYFQAPVLNAGGQTAFVAALDDDPFNPSSGLWSEGTGSLGNVALSGEAATGVAGGATFGQFIDPNLSLFLNSAGQAVFGITLSDYTTTGVWSQAGGTLEKVAADGDPAPGATDVNRVFGGLVTTGLSNAGQVAIYASMPPTSSPPGDFPSSGIWAGPPDSLTKIAEQGDSTPGIAGGGFTDFGHPAINASGDVAFVAGARVLGVSSGQGVWSNASGTLTKIASYDDNAPGTGNTFSILFLASVTINDEGDVAFAARLNGGVVPTGLWVYRSGGIDKIMVEGEPATGTGANFQSLETPFALDAAGHAFFTAVLDDGRRGFFRETDSGVVPIVLGGYNSGNPGDVAPGTEALTYLNVVRWTVNGSGHVAFLAQLSDFSDAIFAEDAAGTLQRIVGEGDTIDVGGGDLRQIGYLSFFGLDGSDSQNGNGQSLRLQ